MRKKIFKILMVGALAVLPFLDQMAQAALAPAPGGMGPIIAPADGGNGFPSWYKDANGLALDLPRFDEDGGFALIDPPFQTGDLDEAGNPLSPEAVALSQQIGMGGEGFYFTTEALMDSRKADGTTGRALLVLAQEAAWINGIPVDGEQMVFNRNRMFIDVPAAGRYTIIYPFGVAVFDVSQARITATNGIRAINANLLAQSGFNAALSTPGVPLGDFGCEVAPCDFAISLGGAVGPFLTWNTFNPNPQLTDPALINPANPNRRYIGSPLIDHQITGSIFERPDRLGVMANIFKIIGPSGSNLDGRGSDSIETELFGVSGRLADVTPPVLTVLGQNPITVRQGSVYTDAGATALDDLDGDVTARIVATGLPLDTSTVGAKTVTYTVMDLAGNTATLQRTVNVAAPVATTITVSPASVTVRAGSTRQFTASVLDQFGADITASQIINWQTSDPTVATIDNQGLLTANFLDVPVTVTASVGNVSGTALVRIEIPHLTTIEVSPATANLPVDGTLTFTGRPLDQFNQLFPVFLSWSIVNPDVGEVDETGLFTAVAIGQTTIRASAGDISGQATVTVSDQIVTTIDVSSAQVTVVAGGTLQITATVLDQFGAPMQADVSWSTDAPLIGTVDVNGLFTALSPGTVKVIASNGAVQGDKQLEVLAPVLTTINVAPSAPIITTATQQFTAATLDQIGNPIAVPVTWTSSNPVVGAIDLAAGLFTVAREGATEITAASGNISGRTTATVQLVLTTINVSPNPAVVKVGTARIFTAQTLNQLNAPVVAQITWTSSNPAVGAIDPAGLFTALTTGNTTITAASGAVTGQALVSVETPRLATISVTPANPTVLIAGTQQLNAAALDQFGDPATDQIVWTSSNPAIGTVNANGLFVGLVPGTVTVRAASGAVSGETLVTVSQFNSVLNLTVPGQWVLFSPPKNLASIGIVAADIDSILMFDSATQQFVQVTSPASPELLNPLNAFFVRPNKATALSFINVQSLNPGTVTKRLNPGWNLVSTNNLGLAKDELASIQVVTADNSGIGATALFAPQTFNGRKSIFSDWAADADRDLNAHPITGLPAKNMSPYDGYWVNMRGSMDYSKIVL